MRKDGFSELKGLISTLRSNELETAKKFVVAFDSNITRRNNKSLKLFKLILKKPDVKKVAAIRHVGKDVQERSFDKLVGRLKSKIFESLALNVNLDRRDLYSSNYRINKLLRKRLTEADIAFGKNILDLAVEMYDKIIATGKRFEIYDVLLNALLTKQQIQGMTKGPKEYYLLSDDVKLYSRCVTALQSGKDWYYRHFIEAEKSGLNNDKVSLLMQAISELRVEYEATDSQNVGYYYFILMMEYYLAVEEYGKSCDVGKKLVVLMGQSMHLFSKAKLGSAYSDLADNQLYVFHFGESVKNSILARKFYKLNSYNFKTTKEIEFLAEYYQGQLESSLSVVNELLETTDLNRTPFHYAKRVYLKACVLFMQGEYRKSYFLLQDTKEIEKDKEGWNIGRRIMSILNHIEIDLLDVADSEIESMRKHIGRLRALDSVRKRDKIILQLLMQLEKHSFDFKKVYELHQESFKALASTEKDLRWEVKTPEMIIFHKWFEAKVNGVPYVFEVPQELIDFIKFGKKEQAEDMLVPEPVLVPVPVQKKAS